MSTNDRLIRLMVGGVALLLLAAVGVVTLDNVNSLAEIEESLNMLTARTDETAPPAEEPTQPVTDTEIAQPAAETEEETTEGGGVTDTEETTEEESVDIISVEDAEFEVVVPGQDNTVVLSNLYPHIHIQLKKTSTVVVDSVAARLLILKRLLPNGGAEPLAQGIASNEATLDAIEDSTANLSLNFDTTPPSGSYEGWLIVTGEGITPTSRRLTVEVITFPSEENVASASLASVLVQIPGANKHLIWSKERPQVDFRLQNLETNERVTVKAQLLIVQHMDGDREELLRPGYASNSIEVTLEPFGTKNVTLNFGDRLPPGGRYVTWLVVSGDGIQTVSEQVTLTVSADPATTIQHRLTAAAAEEKSIIIGGIRRWPFIGKSVSWDSYELRLWEANLQSTDCTVIPSELANKTDGRSGTLEVEPPSPCDATDFPVAINLTPTNIEYPGFYEGTLRIIRPGNAQNEVIPVTVMVRDHLFWPALVIFLGALFVGWAIRYALGDTDKNVAFQRYLIVRARARWEDVCCTGNDCRTDNDLCRDILTWLDNADLALDLNDFQKASNYLQMAKSELDKLISIKSQLELAEAELDKLTDNQRKKHDLHEKLDRAWTQYEKGDLASIHAFLDEFREKKQKWVQEAALSNQEELPPIYDLKIKLRPEGEFFSVTDGFKAYQGEKIFFRLEPSVKYVTWQITKDRLLKDKTEQLDKQEYKLEEKGTYKLTAKFNNNGQGQTLSFDLRVEPDPVKASARRIRRLARISAIVWALIAMVAGLLYIDARLPTFGAPTDYLLALAWAFGLSTAARPTEGIVASILEKLRRPPETQSENGSEQKSTAPSAFQQEQDGQKQPELPDIEPLRKVTVPDIRGQGKAEAQEKLESGGLKAQFTTEGHQDAGTDWVVKDTTPAAGTKVDKGSTVACTLAPPDGGESEEETTDVEKGSKGST